MHQEAQQRARADCSREERVGRERPAPESAGASDDSQILSSEKNSAEERPRPLLAEIAREHSRAEGADGDEADEQEAAPIEDVLFRLLRLCSQSFSQSEIIISDEFKQSMQQLL